MSSKWREFFIIDIPHVDNKMIEYWGESHFKSDVLDKWSLSSYVELDGQVLGYRIVSGKGKKNGFCHTHRTSVNANHLRKGIAKLLLEYSIGLSIKKGYKGITGGLLPINEVSRKFLIAMGWTNTGRIVNGNELWELKY